MVVRSALSAGLTVAALGCAWPATADPAPPTPTPPALTELIPAIGNVLAQTGSQPTGPLGLPDLSAYGSDLLLAQTVQAALPGTPAATVPDLSAFNPEYLLAQNQAPSAPGEGVLAPSLGPMPDDPGTGRIAFLRRLNEMYQGGALTGALLGQVPADQRDELLAEPDTDPVVYPPAALPPAG
jgi:hypothetical protein